MPSESGSILPWRPPLFLLACGNASGRQERARPIRRLRFASSSSQSCNAASQFMPQSPTPMAADLGLDPEKWGTIFRPEEREAFVR